MSWKIYNGFIFKDINTLESALDFFQKNLDVFAKVADEHWKKLIISKAIAEYDNECAENIKKPVNQLNAALGLFWEYERDNLKNNRKSFTDVAVLPSVASVKIKGKKRVIGILFCDNKELLETFYSMPEIEEYAYFNNSDTPEEISQEDWNYRGKVWDKLFETNMTANKTMFSYDIIGEKEICRDPKITQEDVDKYNIPFQDRVEGAVRHQLLKNKTFSNLDGYSEFMRRPDTIEAKERLTPVIESRLNRNITLNDLNGANND